MSNNDDLGLANENSISILFRAKRIIWEVILDGLELLEERMEMGGGVWDICTLGGAQFCLVVCVHLLYYPISLHLTFHCRDASSGIHCVRLETSLNIDYRANKGFEILLPALSSARIHVAFQHRYPFPAVHSCSVTEISLNIDIEKNGEIKCALIFLFHVHSPCFQHHCVSPGL